MIIFVAIANIQNSKIPPQYSQNRKRDNKNLWRILIFHWPARQKLYRAKEMIDSHGLKYFKQNFAKRLHHKSKKECLNDVVIKFSIGNPHLGEQEVAKHLNQRKGVEISKGTVRAVWAKNNMQTIALRQRAAKKAIDQIKT